MSEEWIDEGDVPLSYAYKANITVLILLQGRTRKFTTLLILQATLTRDTRQ